MSGIGDSKFRVPLGVTTVPAGTGATSASTSIDYATARTFIVTTTPDVLSLSLWNFFLDIVVDSTTLDADGQFANLFPDGSGLTTAQRSMELYQWMSWASSSDILGIRVHKIRVQNNDSTPATHTYSLFYKGYTMPGNTGAAA